MMKGVFPFGVVSPQYEDDTFLFLDNSLDSAKNLKWTLSSFEHMSGMRINFHKSDLVAIR